MRSLVVVCCSLLMMAMLSCEPVTYDAFGDIAGEVVDKVSGEPIKGAMLNLSPGGKNMYTGSDGLFEFKELEAGQYTISVQASGYSTDRKTITVIAGETQQIYFSLIKN